MKAETFQIRGVRHVESAKTGNRPTALGETALVPIRHLPSDELTEKRIGAFLSIGFTHHEEICELDAEADRLDKQIQLNFEAIFSSNV